LPDTTRSSVRRAQYLEHASAQAYLAIDNELVVGLHEAGGAAMTQGIADAKRSLSSKNEAILMDLVVESISETIDDVRGVLKRDRNAARKAWQRFAVELTFSGAKGAGAALILAQRSMDALRFVQPDRAGKLWDSGVYARSLYRQFLLVTQVESCLFVMVKGGRDLAVAEWDDDRHSIVFSISGKSTTHPSYLSLKDALFHPNSTATVRPK
jgi:hypothetical protein